MFCGGRAKSLIVFNQSGLEILGDARIMNRLVVFTNENINIEETLHFAGLPSRSLLEHRVEVQNGSAYALLRRGSHRFLRCAPKEGWRRGELNPCPRRYPRKHLHVYPAKNFKEPNVAPAHCLLPSVREIDSQTRRGRSADLPACCPRFRR